MSASEDRRAELIAAAVADDLDEAETAELHELAAADPTIATDILELRAMTANLSGNGPTEPWLDLSPAPELREKILGATVYSEPEPFLRTAPTQQPFEKRRFDEHRFGRRRSAVLTAAAAAIAGVVLGGGVVLGVDGLRGQPENPPAAITGPPGTLGAYEEVAFTTSTASVDIEGGLVAHTWGTETVLEMDGISEPGPYEVILVDRSGAERPSGTFLGSDVTIECRMNAAVLRGDVSEIEIRTAGGTVLARAQLPSAS